MVKTIALVDAAEAIYIYIYIHIYIYIYIGARMAGVSRGTEYTLLHKILNTVSKSQ